MSGPDCYVVDASALIDLHRHFRIRDVRSTLVRLARQARLRMPEGVARELRRKTDEVRQTVERLEARLPQCVVRIGQIPGLSEQFARMERLYGNEIRVRSRRYDGFWKSPSGRRGADGQVLAVAKRLQCTAVSDDRAVGLACMLEDVGCVGWKEFARRLGLVRQLDLPL